MLEDWLKMLLQFLKVPFKRKVLGSIVVDWALNLFSEGGTVFIDFFIEGLECVFKLVDSGLFLA